MTEEVAKTYNIYSKEREELHKEIEAMYGTLDFINWIKDNQKKNCPEEVGVNRIRYKAIVKWFKDLTKKHIATVKADYPTMHEFNISEEDIRAMQDWRIQRIHELTAKMKEL